MYYWLKPSAADAQKLNAILYFRYVSEDGVTFKFPYNVQTINFVKWQDGAFMVDDDTLMAVDDPLIPQVDRAFIIALLLLKKTEVEAIAAGWITGGVA